MRNVESASVWDRPLNDFELIDRDQSEREREMKDLKEKNEDKNTKESIKISFVVCVILFILYFLPSLLSGYLAFHVMNFSFCFLILLLMKLLSIKYKSGNYYSMPIIEQKMIRFEFIFFNILAMALGVWMIQFTEFKLLSVFLVILSLAILLFRTVKCVRCFSKGTAIKGEMILRFYNSYVLFLICSYGIVFFYFAMIFLWH